MSLALKTQSTVDAAVDSTADVHRIAISTSTSTIASYLSAMFGQQLTALMTGIDSPKTVGRWIRGQEPHPQHGARLKTVYQIALLLERGESRQTAQSWFVGLNPLLDDRSPAMVLADRPERGPDVMKAARAYLAAAWAPRSSGSD